MNKACLCSGYDCNCYKSDNLPRWKEEDLLQCLWEIEIGWDTDSIKQKKFLKEKLDKAIKILISRGRETK